MTSETQFQFSTKIAKADESLGLVFGWGIVCTQEGVEYFDLQDDSITEEAMLEATTEFMKSERVAMDMHMGEDAILPGLIVHSFPLTSDIAKAYGINCSQTGWMIAMQPEDPEVLKKFASGEYTGFSIGGYCIDGTEVDADA